MFQIKREAIQIGCKKKVFHTKDGKALVQVAQRGSGNSVPGGTEGQARWGSGQPDVTVLFIARELDWTTFKGPFQLKQFCDSLILNTRCR